MGIREYLARRKRRRALRRAVKTGETLSSLGVTSSTPRTVTGGYVTSGGVVYVSSSGKISRDGTTISPTGEIIPTPIEEIKIPTPSPIQIQTQQQIRAREIYDPRTRTYKVSPYGLGAGGTVIERYPTEYERLRILQAQERGRLGELPPLKFLAGEYEWQKKLDKKKEIEEPKDVWGEKYTAKELYEVGAYPTIVRKGVSRAGLFFVGLGEKITGRPVSPEMKKQTAQAIATLFLFAGFSQAMRTGTYSEQISKQLSKTKFDKLKELLNKAEKKIAQQKTLAEQAKILKQIKDGLKTPEQIKNYNLWVKSLKDKGVFHEVKVDVKQLGEYKPSTITGEIGVEVPKQIPVGEIGVIAIDPSKIREVSWMGEKAKVDQIQEPLSMNIFQEPQKIKEVLISTAALRTKQKQKLDIKTKQIFIQPQIEISKIKQAEIQKQVQLQKQRQIQRERLVQLQKQIQISRLRPKLELEPKLKIPFKFGEAIKRVTKIAKEKPEIFEVFGRRFGKEVKLGIFKTKPEAEKKLEKYLVKTLGAAGFIAKDKKKLKAAEIELLKKKEFRPSKISEFLVIEEKAKRLRKATTGKEIQFFRKKPSKGRKKGKSLFGI